MNDERSKSCIPCMLLWCLLPLALFGWWAFYSGPASAAKLRDGAAALAANGLGSGGFDFASASLAGSVLTVSGVAPDEATRSAAFDAAVAASKKARGMPGVFSRYVNAITIPEAPAEPSAPPPPAAADCQAELTAAMTGANINFQTAQAVILADSYALLDSIAAKLQSCSAYPVEVGGHTDPRGDAIYNKDLSQRRAQAVVDYLVGKGAAATQLTARGYGEERLIDSGTTAEALARNRRTEFTVNAATN